MSNKKAEEYKAKGNDFYSKNNFKDAITWYSKAISEAPKEAVYYSNRSAAYAGVRQWEDSLRDATKAAELKPDWPKGHYRRGVALQELGQFSEAVSSYKKGLQYEAGNTEMKSRMEECEKKIAKSKPRFNKNGTPMNQAQSAKEDGNEAFKASQYEQAIEFYTRAIALCTESDLEDKAAMYNNRAACYSQYHNYPEVVKDSTECLKIQPNNVKALIRRGIAYEALEKFQLGLDDMRQVLLIDPQATVAQQASHRINTALRNTKFK